MQLLKYLIFKAYPVTLIEPCHLRHNFIYNSNLKEKQCLRRKNAFGIDLEKKYASYINTLELKMQYIEQLMRRNAVKGRLPLETGMS